MSRLQQWRGDLSLWWHGDPSSSRSLERQRSDRNSRLFDFLTVTLLCVFVVTVLIALEGVKSDSDAVKHEVRARSTQRTNDLRAECRRSSREDAADVNLNWVYYQSEKLLVGEGEQQGAGPTNPTVAILIARENADYQAARAKAKNIDVRDLDTLKLSTPLGSEALPRAWVLKAHFSCVKAFEPTTGG